jgi:hypothetical protein
VYRADFLRLYNVTLTTIVSYVTVTVNMKRITRTDRKSADTTALNIRNFPDELRWLCRERASQERISLREFVIASLRRVTGQELRG